MHLKRSKMPVFWPIPRKEKVWAVVTDRGPHSAARSVPLAVVMRDILKIASSLREARGILNEGKVMVNGVYRKSYRYPIGPMDIVEIPETKAAYRAVPSHLGFDFEEAKDKIVLARITNKVAVKGKKIQYTTHNGLTLIADNKYKIGDTITLDSAKKIKGHFPLAAGSAAIVTEGKLRGTRGKISEVGARVTLDTADGQVETIKAYIFITGDAA